jgi:hypothetical protein
MVSQTRLFPDLASAHRNDGRSSFRHTAKFAQTAEAVCAGLGTVIDQLSNSPSPPGSAMGSARARRSSETAADRRGPSEPVMPGSRLCT